MTDMYLTFKKELATSCIEIVNDNSFDKLL